jgi:glycosyltransferase involved in cell wall biosynthesis
MIKVLFVHDGPMMSNTEKTVFYGVHYTDEIIARYAFFGDQVTFLMRNKIVEDKDAMQFTKLTHPSFRFMEVPNFKSILTKFRQKEAEEIIEKAVQEHDIIIARLPSANGVIGKQIAEKLGKPVLVEVVACVFDALWNYDWRGKLLAHYKMYQYKNHIQSATHVIYVTEKFLQDRYPTNGKSIGCSDVVLKQVDNKILEKRLRKIASNPSKLVLGTLAAIDVPYKGQTDVIKALKSLKEKGDSNFVYKIVGQGDSARLSKLIQDLGLKEQIEIVGALPHEKVFEFLDSVDIYIQPSKQEGLPRSVVEALSRACPVIATNIAGHPELVNKNSLFEAGNIGELIKLLKDFRKLPLKQWAEENFNRANDFRVDILNQKRIDFYNVFKHYTENKLKIVKN